MNHQDLEKFFQEEQLFEYYQQASEKWKMVELFNDLETITREVFQKTTLKKSTKKLLCLLLCKKDPQEIATILNFYKLSKSTESIRVFS